MTLVSAILLTSTMVVPVTFPVMIKVSLATASGSKFTSRVTVPPPSKLPDTVSASEVSLSSPTLSVPSAETLSLATDRVWAAVPNLIVDPAPMLIVSHPLSPVLSIRPDTLLNASVLFVPPPPVSAPSLLMSAPLNVRFTESSASLMLPLIAAPPSTKTFSQPISPADCTVASRVPEPPLNVSVSTPSPPCISVTAANEPSSNVSMSDPAPRFIFPATVALPSTVTVALPAPSRIALLVLAPTDAPLLIETVTALPEAASVLIAATPAPVPPVTEPDTAMVVAPLPS